MYVSLTLILNLIIHSIKFNVHGVHVVTCLIYFRFFFHFSRAFSQWFTIQQFVTFEHVLNTWVTLMYDSEKLCNKFCSTKKKLIFNSRALQHSTIEYIMAQNELRITSKETLFLFFKTLPEFAYILIFPFFLFSVYFNSTK